MDYLDEIIGLIVVLLVLFFPMIRQISKGEKGKWKVPEEVYHRDGRADEKEEEEMPWKPAEPEVVSPKHKTLYPTLPKRAVRKDFEFHSKLESFRRVSDVEKRHLKTPVKPEFKKSVASESMVEEVVKEQKPHLPSITKLLKGRSPYQKMVIMHEILREPRGMQ